MFLFFKLWMIIRKIWKKVTQNYEYFSIKLQYFKYFLSKN